MTRPCRGVPVSRSFLLSILLPLVLVASGARAETATIVVGSESTFVNVITGERRKNGSRIGRVRLNLRQVEAACREADPAFEGFVRLVKRSPSPIGSVSVDCLQRVEDV